MYSPRPEVCFPSSFRSNDESLVSQANHNFIKNNNINNSIRNSSKKRRKKTTKTTTLLLKRKKHTSTSTKYGSHLKNSFEIFSFFHFLFCSIIFLFFFFSVVHGMDDGWIRPAWFDRAKKARRTPITKATTTHTRNPKSTTRTPSIPQPRTDRWRYCFLSLSLCLSPLPPHVSLTHATISLFMYVTIISFRRRCR